MRVLVTGAAGFVGNYLVEKLLASGHEVLATSFSPKNNQNPAVPLVELDITQRERFADLVKDFRPEVVYHLAAISFVPQAEKDFKLALETNCCGTENLFLALQAADLTQTKVIYISSAEVYGAFEPAALPLTENSACNPLNNYAISKLTAEKVVERFQRRAGFPTVIFRPFNHIGPGQAENFAVSSFSKQIAAIKLGQQTPKMSVGNLNVKIDFLDVRDVIEAYSLVATTGQGIFNLSSGQSTSLVNVIEILKKQAGVELEIEIDPNRYRPAERPEIRGDSSKFQKCFNWQPKIKMEESLSDCLNYWLKKLAE